MNSKILIFIAVVIVGLVVINVADSLRTETLSNCKIIELQQQQLIKGGEHNVRTEIRYLVITEDETLIVESSWLNGKFDNSNIFWHLKKDQVYDLRVSGFGKSLVTDYRNILEAHLVTQKK